MKITKLDKKTTKANIRKIIKTAEKKGHVCYEVDQANHVEINKAVFDFIFNKGFRLLLLKNDKTVDIAVYVNNIDGIETAFRSEPGMYLIVNH